MTILKNLRIHLDECRFRAILTWSHAIFRRLIIQNDRHLSLLKLAKNEKENTWQKTSNKIGFGNMYFCTNNGYMWKHIIRDTALRRMSTPPYYTTIFSKHILWLFSFSGHEVFLKQGYTRRQAIFHIEPKHLWKGKQTQKWQCSFSRK